MNISPEIMNEISDFSKSSSYELCSNCLSRSNIHSLHFGIDSIPNLAAKIWNRIPNEIKEASSLTVCKSKIKKIGSYICGTSVFYIINLLIFGRNPSNTFS